MNLTEQQIEEYLNLLDPIFKQPHLPMTKLQQDAGTTLLGSQVSWGCGGCKGTAINQIRQRYNIK